METLQEKALTYSQRIKRGQIFRKFKSKIAIARQRALKRVAGTDALQNRARKAAIKIVRKIVAGQMGLNYNNLSVAQKIQIDNKVFAKRKIIGPLAKRLFPKIRQKEMERIKKRNLKENLEGSPELVSNYTSVTPNQNWCIYTSSNPTFSDYVKVEEKSAISDIFKYLNNNNAKFNRHPNPCIATNGLKYFMVSKREPKVMVQTDYEALWNEINTQYFAENYNA